MNHFYLGTAPLSEVTWRTDWQGVDFESAGNNLAEFFSWLGSLSATGWLLIAAGIGLACFYWWCLGPFPQCAESDMSDYDYFD
jgi:hypothetical protein